MNIPPNCRVLTTSDGNVRGIITPTGLVIGGAYQPPPQPLTRDQERMQAALLDERTTQQPTLWRRIIAPVWRWL